MIRFTATCQTETPLLSGGAVPRRVFELRPPGVKGALRFWWRAFHRFADDRQLHEAESRLFGGRIPGQGNQPAKALRSKFRIDVGYDPPRRDMLYLPPWGTQQNGDQTGWGDGIRYCLFPVLRGSRIHLPDRGGRPVVKEGFEFELRFLVQENGGAGRDRLADLLRTLWLLAHLGGLGGRTRRGAGSFRITGFEPPLDQLYRDNELANMPPFFYDGQHYKTIGHFISAGLTRIRTAWGMPPTNPPVTDPLPDYTAFRRGRSLIWVFSEPTVGMHIGAMKAMDALGLRMKAFRNTHPLSEAQAMHTAHHSNPPAPPAITQLEKAQMGLPIIYNFRSSANFGGGGAPSEFGAYTAQGIVFNTATGHAHPTHPDNATRRASPLIISCHALPDGTGYAVLSYLPAPLLPPGQRVWLKHRNDPNRDGFPSAPATAAYLLDLVQCGYGTGGSRRHPLSSAFQRRQRLA